MNEKDIEKLIRIELSAAVTNGDIGPEKIDDLRKLIPYLTTVVLSALFRYIDNVRLEERKKAIKAFQEMCKTMCDLGPFCEMQKDCDKCSKFKEILNKLP
jgi:CRISPR/Cas system CSM-associated protein Csm2 small subunit